MARCAANFPSKFSPSFAVQTFSLFPLPILSTRLPSPSSLSLSLARESAFLHVRSCLISLVMGLSSPCFYFHELKKKCAVSSAAAHLFSVSPPCHNQVFVYRSEVDISFFFLFISLSRRRHCSHLELCRGRKGTIRRERSLVSLFRRPRMRAAASFERGEPASFLGTLTLWPFSLSKSTLGG